MKKITILFVFGLTISACKNDNASSGSDYLIFGHFYGMCQGEECIEIFKIENNKLFEDTADDYPDQTNFYSGNYVDLGNEKYNLVSDLIGYFPGELLNETETVLGCPDCADQGGLYVEYNFDGTHKFWMIDQSKGSVPDYLHDFMDKVNEKVDLINSQ